jgi:hypothetical protein
MGSYPRCAPRSGRCGWGQGVVCVRVCLAEASVGLIGGCVRSCRLGGARRHPPPRAHGGSCRWLGLLCRAKRLLTRRLGVCSQVAIRKAEWSVGALARWLLCAVMSAWRCSPPPPAPGSWGLMQVVGLALSREAATDSAAWCVLAGGHSQGGVECWCVGALAAVWCCRCVSVCVGLTHRCARRRKPAWWCSPPLPAPGSWGGGGRACFTTRGGLRLCGLVCLLARAGCSVGRSRRRWSPPPPHPVQLLVGLPGGGGGGGERG